MLYNNAKKLCAFAFLFLFAVLFSSCGVWRDFTTYFNTYYNAKTLFERTEEEILKQKKDIFAFREDQPSNTSQISNTQSRGNQFGNQQFGNQQFTPQQSSQPSGSFSTDLNKVIEKCSKILQYEKESSYFPDALFMTGKSFYYMQEYSKAQRKFVELAGLTDSKYAAENKLWLAKTHLQLRNFDEGLKLIDEVKAEAKKDGKDKLYVDASITKISFYIFREDYVNAVDECKSYLSSTDDEEKGALVAYQLGRIYLKLDDKKSAMDAFASVNKYSPTFDIEFKSRLEHAKLLKSLNKIDESENELNVLRDSGKFKSFIDEVLIELGQIYSEKGNVSKAINLFKEIDSTYIMKPTSGIASMKLGEIYERKVLDYDSSYKYYSKVPLSQAPREMKLSSGTRARNLDKYFQYKNELREFDKEILYISNAKRFMQDSIDYDIAFREFTDQNRKQQDSQLGISGQNPADQAAAAQKQLQLQQEQLKIIAKNKKEGKPIPLSILIAQGKVKKPERAKITVDSVNTFVSKRMYDLCSLFYSELDMPDSAFYYFKKILNDYPKKTVRVQTMYALGTYYETRNDTLRADSLFREIYNNFEKDPLREAAGQKLGLIKKEEKRLEKKNEDPIEIAYVEAERLYYSKKFTEAVDAFKKISVDHPKSDFAPKSIYYTGLIYENDLKQPDSAAVFYGALVKNYDKTKLALNVSSKYQEYTKEKDRIKKEAEAKLKEAEAKKKAEEEKLKPVQEEKQNKEVDDQPLKFKNRQIKNDSTVNTGKAVNPGAVTEEKPKVQTDTTKKKIETHGLNNDTPVIKKLTDKKAEHDTTRKVYLEPDSTGMREKILKFAEPDKTKTPPDTTKEKIIRD